MRSPKSSGSWWKLRVLVVWAATLLALLGVVAWALLYTERSTTALLALGSLACGWLLVVVDRLPPWKGGRW